VRAIEEVVERIEKAAVTQHWWKTKAKTKIYESSKKHNKFREEL